MKIKCECGKIATWNCMSAKEIWACCDDCVPRGCTCNTHLKEELEYHTQEEYDTLCEDPNNLYETLDEDGRQLPCIERWYDKEGWEI